jgi:glycosyltransferase involved in cell wall biosynthesis
MRILVHDYPGHAFPVQLSRGLAERGHDVCHLYSASIEAPRGKLQRLPRDPKTFSIEVIRLQESIQKYNFVQRFRCEREYARRLVANTRRLRPDVVLSGQTPSVAQHALSQACRRDGIRLVTWVQDLYGVAAHRILRRKVPGIGSLVGHYFIGLDRRSLLASHQVVLISEDFQPQLRTWGVPLERTHVIHNWAPLEDLPQRPRENDWSRDNSLPSKLRFVYSGTLSIRHNPELLVALAESFQDRTDAELIVVSQGSGMDWLRDQLQRRQLDRVRLFPFQPFETMADVLGSADVLVAILEPEAGVYCVPSKILSYFCAGRPLLVGIPRENLAARLVDRLAAGLVVPPEEPTAFVQAAQQLAASAELRRRMGDNARGYAEQAFDIERICAEFEALLTA